MPQAVGRPVIEGTAYALAHVPDLVRYGSKPVREIAKQPGLMATVQAHLRGYQDAMAYLPNQAYLGGIEPEALAGIPRPWYTRPLEGASRHARYGEIMPEDEFYGLLRILDDFDLVWLEEGFVREVRSKLATHPLITPNDVKRLGDGKPASRIEAALAQPGLAIPLYLDGDRLVGCFQRGHEEDSHLAPERLLENLTCKATATLALRRLLHATGTRPESVDFLIGCGEEAIGDRYNPGGGNLAKAVGEQCGCVMASGADIKDFCCAPVQALAVGGGLVASGMHQRISVLAGGSLAKLGMKFQGALAHDMPILEDVLAGFATFIATNDGRHPVLRLDAVGRHAIGVGSSQQAVLDSLVTKPLQKLGWHLLDVGKYATELHNPEVTEPSGSGNVPLTNYRMIAATAALREEIARTDIPAFVEAHGMPGYAPTQGHIASAVCFLAQAAHRIETGQIKSAMFLAKGSLFLGRMTQLADGVSIVLDQNDGR